MVSAYKAEVFMGTHLSCCRRGHKVYDRTISSPHETRFEGQTRRRHQFSCRVGAARAFVLHGDEDGDPTMVLHHAFCPHTPVAQVGFEVVDFCGRAPFFLLSLYPAWRMG